MSMSHPGDGNNHDVRCTNCRKLVAKSLENGFFEIKCVRCSMLNVVFDEMIAQVIVADVQGIIRFINKAVAVKSGYTAEEAIGKRYIDLLGGAMSAEFYAELRQKLTTAKEPVAISITHKDKQGNPYSTDMMITPLMDGNGAVLSYIGVETIKKKDE